MMRTTTKQLLATALAILMVASAGCAGWGTDGPADNNDAEQSNDTDDLNQTQNETNQSNTSDSPNQSSDSTSADDDDDSDSSSGSGDSADSQSSSSTDSSDSDSSDDSSESDSATGSSASDSGGQDTQEGSSDGGDSDTSGDSSSDSNDSSGDGSGAGDDDSNGDSGAGSGSGSGGDTGGDDDAGAGDGNGDDDDTGDGTGDGDGSGDGEQQQTNLSITVTNAETGEPVEGLEVSIYLEGYGVGASATTNSDGVAVFDPDDLPVEGEDRSDGKVRIVAENVDDQGYEFAGDESPSTEITLREDNTFAVEVVPQEPEETHTLTVAAGEALPVPNVPITIERHSDGATTTKQTGEGGAVDFTVYPGEYTVSGTDETGHTQSQDMTVDGDTSIMLGQLQRPQPEERTLTVTVVDQDTGEPLEGILLQGTGTRLPNYAEPTVEARTNSDGVAVLDSGVYEGLTYDMTAFYEGGRHTMFSVKIEGDTEYTLEMDIDEGSGGSPAPAPNETTEPNETAVAV